MSVLDIPGMPAAAAAWGFRRLRAAYTGPLCRLRRTGDDAEVDVGARANGTLGLTQSGNGGTGPFGVSIEAWLVASQTVPATYTLFPVKLYDQTGNGRHLEQLTAASQMTLETLTIGGKSRHVASSDVVAATSIPPGWMEYSNGGTTIFSGAATELWQAVAWRDPSTAASGRSQFAISVTPTTWNNGSSAFLSSETAGNGRMRSYANFGNRASTPAVPNGTTLQAIGLAIANGASNNATHRLFVDGASGAAAGSAATGFNQAIAPTRLVLGNAYSSSSTPNFTPASQRWAEAVLFNGASALTTEQRQAIVDSQTAFWISGIDPAGDGARSTRMRLGIGIGL